MQQSCLLTALISQWRERQEGDGITHCKSPCLSSFSHLFPCSPESNFSTLSSPSQWKVCISLLKPWSVYTQHKESSFNVLFYIYHQKTFWLKAFISALNNSVPSLTFCSVDHLLQNTRPYHAPFGIMIHLPMLSL